MGEVKPLGNPSIVRYPDLAENAKKGIRNEVSGAKLLQGDLAEAWHEAGSDYATVAMRYSIVDATLDRATGSVISGDRDTSREVAEVWTFRRDDRDSKAGWQLSAIQQVDSKLMPRGLVPLQRLSGGAAQ
jgi:predicted lipid-binding transport protein (Tim44 family)